MRNPPRFEGNPGPLEVPRPSLGGHGAPLLLAPGPYVGLAFTGGAGRPRGTHARVDSSSGCCANRWRVHWVSLSTAGLADQPAAAGNLAAARFSSGRRFTTPAIVMMRIQASTPDQGSPDAPGPSVAARRARFNELHGQTRWRTRFGETFARHRLTESGLCPAQRSPDLPWPTSSETGQSSSSSAPNTVSMTVVPCQRTFLLVIEPSSPVTFCHSTFLDSPPAQQRVCRDAGWSPAGEAGQTSS